MIRVVATYNQQYLTELFLLISHLKQQRKRKGLERGSDFLKGGDVIRRVNGGQGKKRGARKDEDSRGGKVGGQGEGTVNYGTQTERQQIPCTWRGKGCSS